MAKVLTDQELINELRRRFDQNKLVLMELKVLNEELIQVNRKLEESETLKSHFISNITNEIINPFTSILGLSKAILSVDKENWKKVISMVALIHSEAFNLDFQFRNIFFAAKIEAGEIYPEVLNVNIDGVVSGLVEAFKHEARRKRITITLSYTGRDTRPDTFRTDPEKLKLIVANLLSNALSFSPEGSAVTITVWFQEGKLFVSVRDQGIGISPENKQIIFDRFKRVDSGINSINRGHGLGLSVNKAIIEMLKGQIEVESELGKGSIFTFSIPEIESVTTGFASEANEIFFDADEESF